METDRLQRAQRRLTARTRTLHLDLERANAVFGGLAARVLGSDLRGVRGGDAGYSVGGSNRIAIGGSYNAVSSTTVESANTLDTQNTSFVKRPALIPELPIEDRTRY